MALSGIRAIVTGGASGLGLASATRLAKAGGACYAIRSDAWLVLLGMAGQSATQLAKAGWRCGCDAIVRAKGGRSHTSTRTGHG
jgi:NAD(P)-dependent dehydrogenase (short-subunit alcohol dehydrogenase family)